MANYELIERTLSEGKQLLEQLKTSVRIRGQELSLYNAGLKEGEKRFGLFTRDLLLSAFILGDDKLLRETVKFACLTQGKEKDARTGEEPGKVIHEYEHVKLRGRETRFNACDTTPLALLAFGELFDRGFSDFVIKRKNHVNGALNYLFKHIKDGIFWEDPALCGADRFALRSTYWKDDRLPGREHPDYPVAYSLVQAQTVAGLRAAERLASQMDLNYDQSELRETADAILFSLLTNLWDEERGFPAIAKDERGLITGISSDGLHTLFYLEPGDLPTGKLESIASTAELLNTPYGYRTYAQDQTDYADDSYHLGSLWPFEQFFIARGAKQFGYPLLAEKASRALVALDKFGFYELFGWNGRELRPLGCDRQLWSACLPVGIKRIFAVDRENTD